MPTNAFSLSGGTGSKQEIILDYRVLRKSILTLRALNHRFRKEIIAMLEAEKQITVTEIFTKLNIEQAVASQHIAILRRAGLVNSRRESKFIYYSLNKERLTEIIGLIENVIQPTDNYQSGNVIDGIKLKKALSILRAITHPQRLSVLSFLDKNKIANVNTIQGNLNLDLSLLSQNLKILKAADLVNTERDGKYIYYSVNYKRVEELKKMTHSFFEK